ncbi:MAG: 1-acyl-sn-glycerol-3-phosphate acyltransferase [Gammaproteobacteria bacterium]|nr:1-acyl-sn-glycerol-3-phosphate acyltransferase [Gammaproteobacteria bacterium]
MTFLIIFTTAIVFLIWIGKKNNQADWGHGATNVLDGLLRVYCKRFHRQGDVQIEIPDGKILLAPNHISGIDPFLIITATRRPIRFMVAKEEYEKPLLNWMFRAAGCIPVDRTGRVEGAFRSALRALEAGELVAIFPQGGIHRDDEPRHRIKPGIIRLSKLSGCAILPIKIKGVGAPGTVAQSVVKRSHIEFDVHPVVSPELVQTEEFRHGLADWFLDKQDSIFKQIK